MQKIQTLIIDDETLAREVIKQFLIKDSNIEIVGECDNGFEGFKMINELKPKLIFLDVMMPKLTGFEMLEMIADPPVVIFSTAYDQYAIKAFEANAVDYLLKPYTLQRLLEALEKAKTKIYNKEKTSEFPLREITHSLPEMLTRVAVRTGNKINIIPITKIRYIEAQDDYVKLYTEEGNHLKQQTMKYFESHLPADDFVRIHRSYILRVKEIERLELMHKDSYVAILQDKTQLPVSRTGYSRLKEVLGF